MPGRTRRVLAAACLLLVVVGCTPGGPEGQVEPSPVAAGSLGAELRQDRTQYADRTAAVEVVNDGTAPITVFGARLAAPGFGPSSPDGDPPPRSIPAGSGRDVRIRLGDVDCDAAAPEAATGAAAARTEVATATVTVAPGEDAVEADGTDVTVGVTDPLGRLATVHAEVCAERLIATGARLRVTRVEPATAGGSDDESGSDDEAREAGGRVTLAVEPVPGGPQVRLVRVAGTTLLSPADAAAWTGTALAGQAKGAVVLDVVPARCDPHAVGEDKRGTFLPVTAEVDGARQPVVYVPMSDGQRAAVYDLVHDACGWG